MSTHQYGVKMTGMVPFGLVSRILFSSEVFAPPPFRRTGIYSTAIGSKSDGVTPRAALRGVSAMR